MAETKDQNSSEVTIYKDTEGPAVEVSFEGETAWLSSAQMAALFQKDVNTISTHIRHIYAEGELERPKTVLKKANTRNASIGLDKPTNYYNLDVIISVGYRVKSKRGTQFRIWATQRLRDYLLKGFVVNQERLKEHSQAKLKELEGAVRLLQGAVESHRLDGYEKELLNIITDYTATWVLLNKYDHDELTVEHVTKKTFYTLDHEKVTKSIAQFKKRLMAQGEASELFGTESGNKLKALLGNIEQTWDEKSLYGSLEEKAAHLLYFAIKDHPFVDGNKRIGSLLFLLYLIQNHALYNKKGERKLNDSALAVVALLIAESRPEQKDVMIRLVVNLINKR
ncbi:MAG: virulence protein RhuM/Fic/DOC family protein [Candidatus Doudnabacteria bacterium]|nr:virulence protein RhuM/Fic/DOC family protein [Candidatus Doudnabacteria bacterium]